VGRAERQSILFPFVPPNTHLAQPNPNQTYASISPLPNSYSIQLLTHLSSFRYVLLLLPSSPDAAPLVADLAISLSASSAASLLLNNLLTLNLIASYSRSTIPLSSYPSYPHGTPRRPISHSIHLNYSSQDDPFPQAQHFRSGEEDGLLPQYVSLSFASPCDFLRFRTASIRMLTYRSTSFFRPTGRPRSLPRLPTSELSSGPDSTLSMSLLLCLLHAPAIDAHLLLAMSGSS
jgi:hypothetical protein